MSLNSPKTLTSQLLMYLRARTKSCMAGKITVLQLDCYFWSRINTFFSDSHILSHSHNWLHAKKPCSLKAWNLSNYEGKWQFSKSAQLLLVWGYRKQKTALLCKGPIIENVQYPPPPLINHSWWNTRHDNFYQDLRDIGAAGGTETNPQTRQTVYIAQSSHS